MTTTVVYSNAGDGNLLHSTYALWATKRGSATCDSVQYSATASQLAGASSGSGGYWQDLYRAIVTFDTSAVGAGDSVSAATLSLYGFSKSNTFASPADLDIVISDPASTSTLATGDWDSLGTGVFGSIGYSSISTSAYNDISLTVGSVIKAGTTNLGARLSWDTDDSPSDETFKSMEVISYYSDNFGTTNDPKLTVVHEAPTGAMLTQARLLQTALTGGRLVR